MLPHKLYSPVAEGEMDDCFLKDLLGGGVVFLSVWDILSPRDGLTTSILSLFKYGI